MKAIILKEVNTVELQDVPAPPKALPGDLLIQMKACVTNSGDRLFISGAFLSRHT